MHLPIFLVFLIGFIRSAAGNDNILLPYERFQYDIEHFIPVVEQEVEFAELAGLTDDQAYEQLKSLFPTIQLRIQQLRNAGVQADENRLKHKQFDDQMCGKGHHFSYLKLSRKLKNMQEVLVARKVTVKNNLKMLTDLRDALIDWKRSSKAPCARNG